MSTLRLDQTVVKRSLVATRSQAESYIKLGNVKVNGTVIKKAGYLVDSSAIVELTAKEQYVSRAALKLASVAESLSIEFNKKVVLDVGSSTGGFTDYALRHGAIRVIAVDVGSNQLHPSLKSDPRIELHEKTDIRVYQASTPIDIVLIDVSFISLRQILPSVSKLCTHKTCLVAMVKPQFETGHGDLKHKGVIKNDRIRREILKSFEIWAKQSFTIINKADSRVSGAHGNLERFYILRKA